MLWVFQAFIMIINITHDESIAAALVRHAVSPVNICFESPVSAFYRMAP
jgi:hypothetical protein